MNKLLHPEESSEATAPALAVAPFDAATALRHQELWSRYLGQPVELTTSIREGVELKLMLIQPGEFMMGSPASEQGRDDDEVQHRVQITKPFYLGMYEVTQAQWESVMGSNPSEFKGSEHPVQMVSWNDCQEFIRRLNAKSSETNWAYRLPTEAEWEYACRAGTTTHFFFGDDEAELGEYAWHGGNAGGQPHPVGQKQPNAWGLYDMHGNVWEWCADWYAEDYYANSPLKDPRGPAAGSCRVLRGGAWFIVDAFICRASYRYGCDPDRRYDKQGFRLAMTISSPFR